MLYVEQDVNFMGQSHSYPKNWIISLKLKFKKLFCSQDGMG